MFSVTVVIQSTALLAFNTCHRRTNIRLYNQLLPGDMRTNMQKQDTQIPELPSKDAVLIGNLALDIMTRNSKYTTTPINDRESFYFWVQEIAKRKYISDREFKERVKVRNLKRFHSAEIWR
jgi:hypothetical protein